MDLFNDLVHRSAILENAPPDFLSVPKAQTPQIESLEDNADDNGRKQLAISQGAKSAAEVLSGNKAGEDGRYCHLQSES